MEKSLARIAMESDRNEGGSNFLNGICQMIRIGQMSETGFGADQNQSLYAGRLAEQILGSRTDLSPDEAADLALFEARKFVPTARDAAQAIASERNGPAYCYLAFFGLAGRCKYVKVGMSSHPEMRVYGMTTDNPLDLAAVYACRFPSRSQAYSAEQALLRSLQSISRRGEWVEIDECAYADIAEVARGMEGIIRGANGHRAVFEPIRCAA